MAKANSGLGSKFQAAYEYTTEGFISPENGHEVLREVALRVRTPGARGTHSLVIEARIETDREWTVLDQVVGNESKLISISSWDRIRFRCTTYNSSLSSTETYSSAFFTDGEFVAESINDLNTSIKDILLKMNSTLCDIERHLVDHTNQLETITDEDSKGLL